MKILCVIPARAGSVRVPHKNLQPLGDTTLVGEAVDHALNSVWIDEIAISSDQSEELRDYANTYAINLVRRPAELSTGYRDSLRDVVRHALIAMESSHKQVFDYVVTLQPATPLRTCNLIDYMLDMMVKNNCQGAITGVPIVPWIWTAKGNSAKNMWHPDPYPLSQTFDFQSWQEINAVQISTRAHVLAGRRWDLPLYVQMLPTWAALDIDTPADLADAQAAYPSLLRVLHLHDWKPGIIVNTINGHGPAAAQS